MTFTETRWYERVRRFFPYLPREMPLFAAVTISFWGVAEVLTEATGEQIALKTLALPALLTSFAIASYRAFSKFRAYVPEALVSESKTTRTIYRNGRCGWHFSLARQMLLERLTASDQILHRVAIGAEFIQPRRLSLEEYTVWLHDRPIVLTRLVRSVAIQCILELPNTLASVKSEDQLSSLKAGINELATLYKFAADFEVECHSVHPPHPFEEVHEMTHGWSTPIRDGIGEFVAILGKLASVDRKALKAGTVAAPQFNIEIKSAESVAEFSRKLESIDLNALVEAAACD